METVGMKNRRQGLAGAVLSHALVGLMVSLAPLDVVAGAKEEAKRMYDRIAGVPPSATELNAMLVLMDSNLDNETDSDAVAAEAAAMAFDAPSFYRVTLKNLATPWTNEEQTPFAELNDFSATVIGLVRDDEDFRQVLYGNVLYTGADTGLPAYSTDNNDHYAALEAAGTDLGDPEVLVRQTQSSLSGLPADATAGVVTSRAAAKAFFVAGTNRAMFRFTLMNFLCNDLEQVKDTSLPPDRIRQDVSRSPGGDSRIFLNSCVGCHNGMDPLAQAYAYYEWSGEEGTEDGRLLYTPGQVQDKYHINPDNFRLGYVTPNDQWDNYWRQGQNSVLGWEQGIDYGIGGCSPGSCQGAKALGMELAHSDAFAQCQAKQVFASVCLHEPTTANDHGQIDSMVANFQNGGHRLKSLFVDAAVYCRSE